MAAQMATQATAYEDPFCTLEGYRVVTSKLEVTTKRALQDVESPTRLTIQSSVDSTQGNNILFFVII
jgi:hypothetical protein